jgi:polyisoprenoid-binding protein YceI
VRAKTILTAAIVLFAFSSGAVAADEYKFDAAHTNIGFGVKHMVLSTVKGKFTDFEGQVMYDPNDIGKSSVSVTIRTASVETGNSKRDSDLRGKGFFTAEEYPTMKFESTKIEKKGDGYVAHGNLTIRGVTKKVELPFELAGPIEDPWGNTRIGVTGGLTINRKDYGLSYDNKIADGSLVVADEVDIMIEAEFVKK